MMTQAVFLAVCGEDVLAPLERGAGECFDRPSFVWAANQRGVSVEEAEQESHPQGHM